MKVLFIRPNKLDNKGIPGIPIGMSILQAILKQRSHSVKIFDTTFTIDITELNKSAGRKVDLAFFKSVQMSKYTRMRKCDIKRELLEVISEFNPDIICFSIMSNDFELAKKLTVVVKEKYSNIPLLFGGVHPTVDPEDTIQCSSVDMLCIGEGEEAMVELLEKIEKGEDITNIKNIWVKQEGKIYKNEVRPFIDLDKFPPPDLTGFSQMHLYRPFWGKVYRMLDVETSRGCVFSCFECINPQLKKIYEDKGKYHREKSVAKAIADLKHLKENYGIEIFRFEDEIMFAWSIERCKEFFDLYKKEIGLPFICFGRVEYITEEKIKMFKDAGCISVSIGIEAGNPELRAKILNRHMKNEQIVKAFDLCHKHRVRTTGYQLIALPEEKRSHIFDSIMLSRKCGCLSVASFVYPFHGTPLRKYCLDKGYIEESDPIVDTTRDTIIRNEFNSKARQQGLYKTFVLYTLVPQWMFPVVRICEYNNLFSNFLRNKLIKIYRDKLFRRYDEFYPNIPDNLRKISSLDNPPLNEFSSSNKMMENNDYQIWRKIQKPANQYEFLVGRTLARELHQKNFRDIAIQYVFITPEDAARVFKIIPLSWESIKGVGIDLGGGVGCMSSVLALKDEVEKIYCVEYTEDLVKLCQPVMKQAILKEKADKVISVVGDFDNLELADNSLDFAISWDSIHHSHNPVKTLSECRRVLKPGGRLIIVDRAHNNSTPQSEIDRMHNIIYDKAYLRKNFLDENIIMTRLENGEHEWRFFEWDKFFKDSGFKLLECVLVKTDTGENRQLRNDRNLEEILVPFNMGGFGHCKIAFVLEV